MWEKRVEPNSGTAHVAKCFPVHSHDMTMSHMMLLYMVLNSPLAYMVEIPDFFLRSRLKGGEVPTLHLLVLRGQRRWVLSTNILKIPKFRDCLIPDKKFRFVSNLSSN